MVKAAISAMAPIRQPITSNQISRLLISYRVPRGTQRFKFKKYDINKATFTNYDNNNANFKYL